MTRNSLEPPIVSYNPFENYQTDKQEVKSLMKPECVDDSLEFCFGSKTKVIGLTM